MSEKQYVDYETFKHYDEMLKIYIYYMFHKKMPDEKDKNNERRD